MPGSGALTALIVIRPCPTARDSVAARSTAAFGVPQHPGELRENLAGEHLVELVALAARDEGPHPDRGRTRSRTPALVDDLHVRHGMQLLPLLKRAGEPVAIAALAERVVWRNLKITLDARYEVVTASEERMERAKALLVVTVEGAILNVHSQRLRTVPPRNTDPPIALARRTKHPGPRLMPANARMYEVTLGQNTLKLA